MTTHPVTHTNPAISAAIGLWYATRLTGEKMDIRELCEEVGLSPDVIRAYINQHNRQIRELVSDPSVASAVGPDALSTLLEHPHLQDPGVRLVEERKLPGTPYLTCPYCEHKWRYRARKGSKQVRCHKCGKRVDTSTVVYRSKPVVPVISANDGHNVLCQKCGHSWKSRSRFGRPFVKCHRCHATVAVSRAALRGGD